MFYYMTETIQILISEGRICRNFDTEEFYHSAPGRYPNLIVVAQTQRKEVLISSLPLLTKKSILEWGGITWPLLVR